jgi:thiol-disulfide isomerase/thioredoxin
MLGGAMVLARNFAMTNFLNPNLADQLKAPQNIYGRNVLKSEKKARDQQIIKSLAPKIELFVFREDNCAHCLLLEKHLHSFANKYGFNVEAVSKDESKSSYFKTHHNSAITKALNLSVMPTVIAVTKDSSMRFELARGAVSIPDLEDKALLLAEYLKTHLNTVGQ